MTISQLDKEIDLAEVQIKSYQRKIEAVQKKIDNLKQMKEDKQTSQDLMAHLRQSNMSIEELKQFLTEQQRKTK